MHSLRDWLQVAASSLLPAYLIGSIPYGYLLGRLKGIDIRQHGSGNIGATNVWRVMGRYWGLTVFALDFLKVPLADAAIRFLIRTALPLPDRSWVATVVPLVIFVGTVLGHNFPFGLRFKGGKGIATSGGGLLWLMPGAFFAVLIVWLVVFAVFRMVSLASIVAGIALPIATWFSYPDRPLWFWFGCFLSGMAIWRHRANIQRLMNGTEHRWTRTKS